MTLYTMKKSQTEMSSTLQTALHVTASVVCYVLNTGPDIRTWWPVVGPHWCLDVACHVTLLTVCQRTSMRSQWRTNGLLHTAGSGDNKLHW